MTWQGVDRGLTAYGDEGFSRFLRRAFLASAGFDEQDLDRPVVGIADTSSDYTTCHRQMPELVRAVERGVLEAGGLPLVFGSMSLPEILLNPTSMLFRNLDAMVTEELLRAQPMDAAVLVGGCDKTVPGAGDGGSVRGRARGVAGGRADAHFVVPGPAARRVHGLPQHVGPAPRG